jgi:hypothetical protein
MEKTYTVKQFVKLICKESPDHAIIAQIDDWKTKPFASLFGNTTWYEMSKDYFKKYLTKFGRTEVIEYICKTNN